MKRPASLAELATATSDRQSFHRRVADFLDEFRWRREPTMLAEEPPRLTGRFAGGEVADASLAAVAVSLAREIHSAPPVWAWTEDRKLREPWFADKARPTSTKELPALRRTKQQNPPQPADWQSAKQQVGNLRYRAEPTSLRQSELFQ